MSDKPEKHEKQFDPTPQRLKKAREEGNVFRSKELISTGLLAAAVGAIAYGAADAFDTLELITRRLYRDAPTTTLDVSSTPALFAEIGWHVGSILLPLFLLLLATSMGLSVVQTGWNVTLKPLEPKANRISPLQGLKRIFSSKGLFEVVKAIIKIAVVGPLAYFVIRTHLSEIMLLHTIPLPSVLDEATGWIMALLWQMLVALLVLSAADFAFEKWKYKEDLKMTKREVKDETKQQEGDPHVRNKRKQLAQEMRRRPRLDHAVLNADVVVTNPTHYAIALSYDPDASAAPRVLAKGIRKRALRIKELAAEHEVPTVEDRPLAHALYDNVDEEEEIPEELYPAVAAILAEVYRRHNDYGTAGPRPPR